MSRRGHDAAVGEGFRSAFAAALTARDPAARPAGLDPGQAPGFAVYRNNVHRALGEALGAAYPAVRRLVGEAFFASMAREFFLAERARPRTLALYGAGFADFIAAFAPAQTLPWLADVARVERAWLEACHAADAPVLDPQVLAGETARLADYRFDAHPAARLVISHHPVVSLWRANAAGDGERQGPVEIPDRRETALVTRPALAVQVTALGPGEGAFAAGLLAGRSVTAAHASAVLTGASLDLAPAFAALLSAGAFTTGQPEGDPSA